MSCHVMPYHPRVSISDIVLAQSIMTRKALTEPPTNANANTVSNQSNNATAGTAAAAPSSSSSMKDNGGGVGVGVGGDASTVRPFDNQPETANNNTNNNSTTKTAAAADDTTTAPPSIPLIDEPGLSGDGSGSGPLGGEGNAAPSYTFSLNLGSMSWVGINDFNGQNVPVVRALLDGTTFYAEGYPHKLQGDGSLIASADFYNPALAVWEPILDRWHPSLSLSTWQTGQFTFSYVSI